MAKTSFFSKEELRSVGFKRVGAEAKISRFASFYSPEKMVIGDNVRIDDFCILSGEITLGSNIHISAGVFLYGSMGIELEDFTGISPHSVVFSAMDDFSGNYLIGSIHPEELTKVDGGKVLIERFAHIGSNSLLFPNLTIGCGTIVGACSLVRHSLPEWGIYAGVPVKFLKNRERGLLEKIY